MNSLQQFENYENKIIKINWYRTGETIKIKYLYIYSLHYTHFDCATRALDDGDVGQNEVRKERVAK
jgi:hypothetical protein